MTAPLPNGATQACVVTPTCGYNQYVGQQAPMALEVVMHRGSDQHGPRADDEMKSELQGMLQANRPTRAEEWDDAEPPADDDPAIPPFDQEQNE